jgi:hypothetical protein
MFQLPWQVGITAVGDVKLHPFPNLSKCAFRHATVSVVPYRTYCGAILFSKNQLCKPKYLCCGGARYNSLQRAKTIFATHWKHTTMATENLTESDKRELAKMLWVKDTHTPKQIAQIVGAGERTITKWAKDGKWDSWKKSLTTTKAEQIALMYDILAKLNRSAREALEDEEIMVPPNTDAIIKISTAIDKLERETGLGDMIQTGLEFIKFVQAEDLEAAKVVDKWFYVFIQEQMDK